MGSDRAITQDHSDQNKSGLFEFPAPNTKTKASFAAEKWVKRVQVARFNTIDANHFQLQDRIRLNLFEDVTLDGIIQKRIVRSADELTLYGTVENNPFCVFFLTKQGETLIGQVQSPDGAYYEIRSAGPQLCELLQVDPAMVPEIPNDPIPPESPEMLPERQQKQSQGQQDDGSVLDMMIVFTPRAKAEAGGLQALEAVIFNAIDKTNLVLENSAVDTRVRLVHYQEAAFIETLPSQSLIDDGLWCDDGKDLALCRDDGDGVIDYVHDWRDTYGADLTVFLTFGIGKGGILGQFSLVGWRYANFGYTFPHEVGHNLGCHHAVGDCWHCTVGPGLLQGDGGAFHYSHGWNLFVQGTRYCTVMAYESKGWKWSNDAIQIPYYSNPDVLFQNVQTGRDETAEDGANNALTVNIKRKDIANYRQSKPAAGVPTITAGEGQTGQSVVGWSPSSGATHYRVYRSLNVNDNPAAISEWITETEFADTTCEAITPYYYRVKAAKSRTGSLQSDFSQPKQGWRKLAIPGNVDASDGTYTDKVLVKWDAVPGATHYAVYRSESLDGAKIPLVIGTTWKSDRVYIDSTARPQTNYYYWIVAATDRDGSNPTPYSEPDSGWRQMLAPTVTALDGTSSEYIEVSWTKPTGSTYYRLSRSESLTGPKTHLSDWRTNISFQDRNVIPARNYYYWVCAATNHYGFDGTGYSDPDIGWMSIPTPVQIFAGDGTDTQSVPLAWDAVWESAYYRVYRSSNSAGTNKTPISNWIQQTEYNDASAVPGTVYYYFVDAAADRLGTRATNPSPGNSGWRRLLPPGNVTASDGTYTDRIRITWDAVTGASTYCVLKANSMLGTKTPITGWQASRVYEDRDIVPGANRYYWVQAAVDTTGNRPSDYSAAEGGSVGLTPPTNVAATHGTDLNKVVITWDRLAGTLFYQVYRSIGLDTDKVAITDWVSQAQRYEDANGKAGDVYYYWVRAATSSSGAGASPYSASDFGYRYLPPPTGVTASAGLYPGRIEVQWNPVSVATHYRVFRSDSPTGTIQVASDWQPQTIYNDTSVEPGHTYYYYIKAAGSAAGAGASSYSTTMGGFSMMPPPGNVAASNGAFPDKIRITWTHVAEAFYFQVFRATSLTSEKTPLNQLERISWFDDTTAQAGTFYYYWVKASRGSTGYGLTDLSAADVGWISPPAPERPTVSNGDYSDKIVIEWPPVAEGVYYHLSRTDAPNGDQLEIGSWQVATRYEDTQVEAGHTYYYYVRAANNARGDGASAYSPPNGGSRKMPPPETLWVTQGTLPEKVNVRWSPVLNAVFYQVYRSDSENGEIVPLSGWQRLTRFDDLSASPETIYYYWVKAARGFTGYGATDFSVYQTGWLKPSPPTKITATDGDRLDGIQLSWLQSGTNYYYRVSRAESHDGEKNPLGTWSRGTTFNDTGAQPEKTYYYWVQAALVGSGDGSSDLSVSETGWRGIELPNQPQNPNPPDGAVDVPTTVLLDWPDCARSTLYNVYLSKRSSSNVMFKIASEPPRETTEGIVHSQFDPPGELEAGTTYQWQVTATNRCGETSGPLWTFTTQQETLIESWMLH